MALRLEWNDLMSTGIEEVDEQHKKLLNAINDFGDAIRLGKGKDELINMLKFANDYAIQHFKFEESCFTKYHCPTAEKNKAAHAEFRAIFDRYWAQFQQEGASDLLLLNIHNEFATWLVNHIWRIDTTLKPCVLKEKNAAQF